MNKINFLRCFEIKYKVKKNKINEKKDVLSPDKKITKHTSDTIKIYIKLPFSLLLTKTSFMAK